MRRALRLRLISDRVLALVASGVRHDKVVNLEKKWRTLNELAQKA